MIMSASKTEPIVPHHEISVILAPVGEQLKTELFHIFVVSVVAALFLALALTVGNFRGRLQTN